MDELDHQQQQIMGLYVVVENQQQHLELEPVFDDRAEFDPQQNHFDITSMSNVAPTTIVYAFNLIESLQSTEVDGVLASQATEEASVYWGQATPNLDGFCTTDAADHGLEHGVCDSSLTNWSSSFS
ncbi:hypothetical protein OIU76_005108 [Salix suchowensis]|nr:hypothetical protein OIU76_005108 [Salix suchowensis]